MCCMKNKEKTAGMLAGILFLLGVIITLKSIIDGGDIAEQIENGNITIWNVFQIVGIVLIAVSMFVQNHKLFAIGSGMSVIYPVFCLVQNIKSWGLYVDLNYDIANLAAAGILNMLSIISWAILVSSVFKRCKVKTYCIIAAGVAIIGNLVYCIGLFIYFGINLFVAFLIRLLTVFIPIVLAGYALSDTNYRAKFQGYSKQPAINALSQVDKLTKLKGLLDSGVITQEEFDEKKKQILGL